MKKVLLSTLAAVTLLTAGVASAGNDIYSPSHMYTVGQLGFGMGDSDYKEHAIANVGIGYHMNDYMRSDLTIGWRGLGKVKVGDVKTDSWSVPALMNVYATMPITHGFSVYGMGGLGMSLNRTDKKSDLFKAKTKFSFAWNVGAGVDYKLCENWSLDLGYRFTDLGQARVKDVDGYTGKTKADLRSHDVLLSARYYF
ncbi:MAG: porin family protein [Alphaproteobacteria bacterium]|nr:porin family protein [Alphaproteobacteria bacterium]